MNTDKSKYLIVISYDAFSKDNWEMASKLPNLSKLIKNGAYSTSLKSVYPTLTYVAHTTMVTGVYPDQHGVYHNNPFQPFVTEAKQRWFWYKKDIKVPTIYDCLKKHHMKSAALLWPVTGRSVINYNLPEIRAIKKENQILKILRNGSPLYCISMEKKFGRFRKGIKQPYLDDFTTMCAVDTIIKNKPNLLLMHLIDLDDAKHQHGTDSLAVEKAIIRMDKRLGDIIQAVEKARIKEETTIFVLGDHGQINIRYKVKLNQLLKEKGLIYEENGQMKWRAYLQSTGGSAYLHVKENDSEAERMAVAVINQAISEDCFGIERLYNRTELDHYHVETAVNYMLEAKNGYCFDDDLEGPMVARIEASKGDVATHGYLPDKPNYQCNFVASGVGIKNNYQLGEMQMVDIAPTMATILGIDFYDCDGRSLTEMFQNKTHSS
ncbi:alkaline phosphatase family protein [Acetobacterium woodii]|uniref:Type I phosphodiesterase/nucleotide pyrophosphatase Npp n=1 Tax=Acetobacterium woodii (strain ATCC 29683 / DSM 1030 / JCM 2381 / KCTC 1655 / WB1) TaxID=931626 RepID=H6LHS7_ACEWD|nr:ectonucleotide pyrophosphatase/phosphodiesterase [Acetobacterium woodii]AFA47256.1 type I phosphodiesterase/nucleotide pyrophosphatase Npp [Acetobacterium woodii DSM 1030]